MQVILIGPPNAGKGTQASKITQTFGLAHISTGDIFRRHIKEETALGMRIREYVESGALVPDELTIDVLRNTLEEIEGKQGFLLDGFPRNLEQAQALECMTTELNVPIDAVILLDVPEEDVIERAVGRRICKSCSQTYHVVFRPPVIEGVCDRCGGQLYQRPDDDRQTAKKRYQVFEEQTQPLIDYYEQKGLLHRVNGQGTVDEIFSLIDSRLKEDQ